MSITTGSFWSDALRFGACTALWTLCLLLMAYQALVAPELQQVVLSDRMQAVLVAASGFQAPEAGGHRVGVGRLVHLVHRRLFSGVRCGQTPLGEEVLADLRPAHDRTFAARVERAALGIKLEHTNDHDTLLFAWGQARGLSDIESIEEQLAAWAAVSHGRRTTLNNAAYRLKETHRRAREQLRRPAFDLERALAAVPGMLPAASPPRPVPRAG